MNLLVYNFFDESADELDNFVKKTKSSVFFAVSLADVFRILRQNKIDKVILKLRSPAIEMINEMVQLSSKTDFYIFADKVTKLEIPNVCLLPYQKKLNSIKL